MKGYVKPFLAGFVTTAIILFAVEANAQAALPFTNEVFGPSPMASRPSPTIKGLADAGGQ